MEIDDDTEQEIDAIPDVNEDSFEDSLSSAFLFFIFKSLVVLLIFFSALFIGVKKYQEISGSLSLNFGHMFILLVAFIAIAAFWGNNSKSRIPEIMEFKEPKFPKLDEQNK